MSVQILKLESLDKITPMANTVIIKNLVDSVEDFQRSSQIFVVRNDANKLRERAIGTVIKAASSLYIGMKEQRTNIPVSDVLNENVLYDQHGRLYKLEIDNCEDDYYLVRFPDILSVIELDGKE